MKKNLLILIWALAPVALLAYHFGPGQNGREREKSKASIQVALDFEAKAISRTELDSEAKKQWRQAIDAYNDALAALPDTETAKRQQLQLARANARIYVGELPEAMLSMEHLLDETAKGNDRELESKVRSSLASAQYHTGWSMRLELAEKEEWKEPLEKARQNFRLLAEQTAKTDAKASEDHQKNLEAVVRLARMDLSEVQALPLPKKCEGNKNVCSKCRGQKKSNKPKAMKKKEDARGASGSKRHGAEPTRLTHNDYLQQASDSGWPGFALYAAFFGGAAWVLARRRLDDPLLIAVRLGLLAWALQGFVEFGLYIPALAWPAWLMLGWLLASPTNQFDKSAATE